MTTDPWAAIEEAARQVVANTPPPPIAFGDRVAWTEHSFGRTNGLSASHRALDEETTLCGETIPGPVRRLTVVYRSLHPCGRCIARYAELKVGMSA